MENNTATFIEKLKKIQFKKFFLDLAELTDAWRIIPRLLVLGFGVILYQLVEWYKDIGAHVKMECNVQLLTTLLDRSIPVDRANEIACTVSEIVGGPTGTQMAIAATFAGLAATIFGFYANTGRKWDK